MSDIEWEGEDSVCDDTSNDDDTLTRLGILITTHDILDRAERNLTLLRGMEVDRLDLAAHWADLHHPDTLPPPRTAAEEFQRRRAMTNGVVLGGDGTPEVMVKTPIELGIALQTTTGSARHLIADSLDLRHRLPRLWQLTHDGRVDIWKARHIAKATRDLSIDAAAHVDQMVADPVTALPWTRFLPVLGGRIKEADPVRAFFLEQQAAAERFVRLGRITDAHLRKLSAQGDVIDMTMFKAAVDRVAHLLGVEGDTDPIDVRRSKALGVLARPDHAVALLARHADDEPEAELPDAPGPDAPDSGEPAASRTRTQNHPWQSHEPRVQLHVHVCEESLWSRSGVARIEGLGPVTIKTLWEWFHRPEPSRSVAVTIRPVVDLRDATPVDDYEIPDRLQRAIRTRHPGEIFPYGPAVSRTCDLDHTIPYRHGPDAPPGQTSLANLGPISRQHHNAKTHAGHQLRQPAPGVFLWRSPHGHIHLVTNQGTYPLGHTAKAHAIWDATTPGPAP